MRLSSIISCTIRSGRMAEFTTFTMAQKKGGPETFAMRELTSISVYYLPHCGLTIILVNTRLPQGRGALQWVPHLHYYYTDYCLTRFGLHYYHMRLCKSLDLGPRDERICHGVTSAHILISA